MPITYGGVPLVCEDPGGALQGWLDQYLALEELRDQTGTASLTSNRADSRSGYRSRVSLPRPNYPPKDRAKLFTLYWPTGAARWSTFYALATTDQYDEIAALVELSSGNVPLTLKLDDGATSLSTSMYCLTPRKISAGTPVEPIQGLWLLPLVDVRYYWQQKDAGQFRYGSSKEFSDWTTVFSLLGTALGVTVNADSVSSAYNIPDPDEMTRSYENAAVLLDAVSHSVGHRIVRQIDGTVSSVSYSTSGSTLTTNKSTGSAILGGDSSTTNPGALVPETLRVVFPKWYYGAPDPYGGLYNVDKAASTYTDDTPVSGMVKTIHTTAFADFSTGGSSPDNSTEVTSLANRIALDYFSYLDGRYDVSYAGVKSWTLSGYDDCVEWCFGRKADRPAYQAFTRARSLPYNFGVEEQLSQFTDCPVYPSLTRFELSASLSPGGNALAYHVKWDGSAYTTTSDKLKVYDYQSKFNGAALTRGWAQFKGDSLRWEVVQMNSGGYIWGTTGSSVTFGGSTTITVVHYEGANPGSTITAYPDETYTGTTIDINKYVRCKFDATANKYWIVGAQC